MSSPFQNNANIRLEAVFCIDVSIEGIFITTQFPLTQTIF